jgi:acyl carrier protein
VTQPAKLSAEEIRQQVKKVTAMVADRQPDEIPNHASFADDLAIDSLGAMEILVDLEKKYGIVIPEEEFSAIKTIDDATQRCLQRRSEQAAEGPCGAGGGRGIRTPGTVSRTAVFKTARFDRSRIPPRAAPV